jgi:hypothetical protein
LTRVMVEYVTPNIILRSNIVLTALGGDVLNPPLGGTVALVAKPD